MHPNKELACWILLFVGIAAFGSILMYYIFSPIIGVDPTTRLINALISTVAFIIAFLAIYLSYLKGPDIDLIDREELKFELVDKIDDPERIRRKRDITKPLELQPFTLIFVNSGSRTGVIKRLKLDFTRSNDFSPFFTGFYYRFRDPDSDGSYVEAPFSIKNGEVRLVKLDSAHIEIKRFDSVKEINLPNSIRNADIITVIKEVDNANQRNLEGFINFLSLPPRSLGRCSLQWSSTTREKKIELDVTGTYNQIFEWYSSALQKYDELPLSVTSRVNKVNNFLRSQTRRLERNLENIRNFEGGNPPDRLFDREDRSEEYHFVLRWKNEIIDDLESLNTEFENFSETRSEYFRIREDEVTMKRLLFRALEEQKVELEPQIEEVLGNLRETQEAITQSLEQLETN